MAMCVIGAAIGVLPDMRTKEISEAAEGLFLK